MVDPSASGSRFVRQFALTRGRARSLGADLPLDAIVVRREGAVPAPERRTPEAGAILALVLEPLSVAEISAHLGVHLGIARVLVSDLASTGCIAVWTAERDEDGPDLATLERLLDDLQSL